jgi:V/A-type H+-transporting ATPase subunit E
MEIQLQELIDKIKKEGLDSAAEEAAVLKTEAGAEARRILELARKEADAIRAKAKEDAERAEKAGIAAVGQASRNVILSFKAEIQALLDKIVVRETAAALNGEVLKAALPDILKGWVGKDSLDLILGEAQLKSLSVYFREKLAADLKKGLELKSDRNMVAGFRIAGRDGSAFYDFSAESVAKLLSAYLNPKLAETLQASAQRL